MNTAAVFFAGYIVGLGAALFAVALGQAAKGPEIVTDRVRTDPRQLDMELAEFAERQGPWRVN